MFESIEPELSSLLIVEFLDIGNAFSAKYIGPKLEFVRINVKINPRVSIG